MKYLKKYKKFLENDEFEINDTDEVDVKMSKEKLNNLKDKLAQYNQYKSKIDSLYKSDNSNIEDELKKIIGENEFLLSYSNIISFEKKLEKNKSEEERKKLELSEFKDKLNTATEENKEEINNRVKELKIQIIDLQKDINDKTKKLPELKKDHEDKMINIKKEMEGWINNIN